MASGNADEWDKGGHLRVITVRRFDDRIEGQWAASERAAAEGNGDGKGAEREREM